MAPTCHRALETALGVVDSLIDLRYNRLKELAGVKGSVALAGGAKARAKKVQLVHGACTGHIEKSALFFDITVIHRALQRE
jgi:hypothetical protein